MAQIQIVPTGSPQQPGQYVIMKVVNNNQTEEDWKKNFPFRAVKYTGLGQVVAAVTAIVVQIVLTSIIPSDYISPLYSGFWCGIFFATAGTVGLITAANPGRCFNITYLVLSVVATVFAFTMLGLSLASMSSIRYCINEVAKYNERIASSTTQSPYPYHSYNYDPRGSCGTTPRQSAWYCGILILISLLEAIISITSTVISGRAACYKCGCCGGYQQVPNPSIPFMVQHVNEGGNTVNTATLVTSSTAVDPNTKQWESNLPPAYMELPKH